MKIFITGAAGFVGSNLTLSLLKKDNEVWGMDNCITGTMQNLKEASLHQSFHFLGEDVTTTSFSGLPAMDVIFHLASPASPVQYKKYPVETLMANSLGTKRVLDFMKESKSKKFLISSTSEVYGDPAVHPQVETYWGNVNPSGVRSCYDESKRFAESVVMTYYRKYHLDVRIARLFNTYGPNMEQNDGRVVSNFIMQAIKNEPLTIYGDGLQTRSFCYVSDMVEGLTRLATVERAGGETVNLGNPEERTVNDLARLVISLTGSSSSVRHLPIGEDDPKKRKPDIAKAIRLTGWKPLVDIEEGLRSSITYFKSRFL